MTRHIEVQTVLGAQYFALKQLRGNETVSTLFDYDIELIAPQEDVDLERLLGTTMTVTIKQENATRYINGIVIRAEYVSPSSDTEREHIYAVKLAPWLWYTSQKSNSRIFQEQSVPDMIKKVVAEYPFELKWQLSESYRSWPYCVQYDETDFQFIARLMEQEGIFYWFEHKDGKHILNLADSSTAYKPIDGESVLPYYSVDQSLPPQGIIVQNWQESQQFFSNKHTMADYFFEKSAQALDVDYTITQPANKQLEIYDPLGGYFERSDGDKYVQVMAESYAWQGHVIQVQANYAMLATGKTFSLKNRENTPDKLWIIGTHIYLSQSARSTQADERDFHIEMTRQAIPTDVPYRHPKITPVPKAYGPMTARVVGTRGEEIFTDKYGRIKVQFHWDREGQRNENSSCWLRVSSPWAGGGFGGVQIPRINDEVIVGFVGGFIDRPIVVGRVYNADNMPTWNFPDDATQMGTVTRTKFGDASTANFMRLQDKPNEEMLGFQAQKDMNTKVKNNEDLAVSGTQTGEHGGTTDLSVGGYDDNIFKDSSTETNQANQVRTIKGTSSETVTGPRTHTLSGNANILMSRGYVQSVSGGLADYTYGAGRDRTVETEYTRTATGPFTRKVSGSETVTINSAQSTTVQGGPQTIETGTMTVTTTAGDATAVSKTDTQVTAGSSISVSTPASIDENTQQVKEDYNNKINLTLIKSADIQNVSTSYTASINLYGANEGMYLSARELSAIKVVAGLNTLDTQLIKYEAVGVALKGVGKSDKAYASPAEFTAITIKNA